MSETKNRQLVLVPIQKEPEENREFMENPICRDTIQVTIDYFKKIGFTPPWIGYYVKKKEHLVGSGAFKGPPVNGKVEIAYGTFESYRKQGIGTLICRQLVELSLRTDPAILITARTLPEKNYSARILEKNGFVCTGIVMDPDDGEVWEWIYNNKDG